MQSIALQVSGMRCMSCAGKVERLSTAVAGVAQAQVDLLGQRLLLELPDDIDFPALMQQLEPALRNAGYTVHWQRTTFAVRNLSCAGCARKVETKALQVLGVATAVVDVLAKKLTVQVVDASVLEPLAAAVASIGYPLHALADEDGVVTAHALPASSESAGSCPLPERVTAVDVPATPAAGHANTAANTPASTTAASGIRRVSTREYPLWQVIGAFVCALPLLLPMLWSVLPNAGHWMLPPLWQLALALPVQFYFGARFYRGAFYALKSRTGSMDLLVSLGTSAAFGLSLYNGWLAPTKGMPDLYFESASVVIVFVLLGKYLEEGVKQQTQSALAALAELQPQQVRVWRDEIWQWLALSQVVVGDRVQVKPGERVALDGVVLVGESQVDEALISGESQPLHKGPHDALVSGALNMDGVLEFQVQKQARDSRLQQLIGQVEQAQLSKAPLQQTVDRISSYFVPVVLVIAFFTCVLTYASTGLATPAILHAVSVLVIACPCALGLATPAALVVGIGRAARFGILLKNAAALDALSRIDTVFFDKTGTVTLGQPTLSQSQSLLPLPAATLLQWAASLQQHSEHPQAHAFLTANQQPLLEVQNYQVLPGLGVQAQLPTLDADLLGALTENTTIPLRYFALGSVRLAQRLHLVVPDELNTASSLLLQLSAPWELTEQSLAAQSAQRSATSAKILAAYWLDDQVRPSAAPAVCALRSMGIQSVLLSGDLTSRVQPIAQSLGVARFFAEQQPEQKLQQIQSAQQQGQRVAMVGDGINDAPALAQADVGVALTTGTQVAAASSQVSLLDGDLALLVAALDISRRTRAVIWQNLGWAFGFNLLAIPAAALGYLTPALAGAAMAMSSVLVVTNALRLKRWQPRSLQNVSNNVPAPTLVRDLFH